MTTNNQTVPAAVATPATPASAIPARQEKFLDAARQLTAQGKKPTYQDVFALAGGKGSMSDVAAAVKIHNAEIRAGATQAAAPRVELPEDQIAVVMSAMSEVWSAAHSAAQADLDGERAKLDELRESYADENKQLSDAADAANVRSESLQETIVALEAEKATLAGQLTANAAALAERDGRINVLSEQLAQAHAEANVQQQQAAAATARADELATRCKEAEAREKTANSLLMTAQGEIAGLRAEVRVAEIGQDSLKRENTALAGTITATQKLADDRQLNLDALKADVEKLKGEAAAASVKNAELEARIAELLAAQEAKATK